MVDEEEQLQCSFANCAGKLDNQSKNWTIRSKIVMSGLRIGTEIVRFFEKWLKNLWVKLLVPKYRTIILI